MGILANKKWWKATTVRTVKTFAEAMIGVLGMGQAGVLEVDWIGALSASALAAIVAFCTCLAGLPEVESEG